MPNQDKPCKDLHPTLTGLIDEGLVWYDEGDKEFCGLASNGVEVGLGCDADGVERYLVAFPRPTDW